MLMAIGLFSRLASSRPTSSADRTVDHVDLGHRRKESAVDAALAQAAADAEILGPAGRLS
jgi:hypothetical protein